MYSFAIPATILPVYSSVNNVLQQGVTRQVIPVPSDNVPNLTFSNNNSYAPPACMATEITISSLSNAMPGKTDTIVDQLLTMNQQLQEQIRLLHLNIINLMEDKSQLLQIANQYQADNSTLQATLNLHLAQQQSTINASSATIHQQHADYTALYQLYMEQQTTIQSQQFSLNNLILEKNYYLAQCVDNTSVATQGYQSRFFTNSANIVEITNPDEVSTPSTATDSTIELETRSMSTCNLSAGQRQCKFHVIRFRKCMRAGIHCKEKINQNGI